jgi:hypothetical protein
MPVFRLPSPSLLLKGLFATFAAALLVACGSSDAPAPAAPLQYASSNLTVPVTAANAAALANLPFVFPNGVPEFGTTGTTTVTLTDTSTTPAFSIVTPNGTATGVMTFGSCIFRVTATTIRAGSIFTTAGDTITIPDCKASLQVIGQPANGSSFQGRVSFDLNGRPGISQSSFRIGTDGTLFNGGFTLGRVTLAFVTGS